MAVNPAHHPPLEVPPGFGLRQPSGAFPVASKKAPEGWRSPRRCRAIVRSLTFSTVRWQAEFGVGRLRIHADSFQQWSEKDNGREVFALLVAPTETFRKWPIDQPAFPDHVVLRDFAPRSGIETVQRVIAHRQEVLGADDALMVFIQEEWR